MLLQGSVVEGGGLPTKGRLRSSVQLHQRASVRYVACLIHVVHPVNGEVPPVKGRPWKLPHYANRGKTSSSGGELASARSCFSTVRTALGKLRITGLLARFDVARSFPQFPRPLLLQPTIWTSERGADLGSGRCQPRPHLPIYRMTHTCLMTEKPRETQAESHVVELKEKVNNSSLMKHQAAPDLKSTDLVRLELL